MPWDIEIKIKKPLSIKEFDSILPKMPEHLHGACVRQTWGWAMAVDVWKPEGYKLEVLLSGKETSRPVAREFAEELAVLLEDHRPRVGEIT